MTDYQIRVAEEKDELDEKIDKLRKFRQSPAHAEMNVHDQGMLARQQIHMTDYSIILGARLYEFNYAKILEERMR